MAALPHGAAPMPAKPAELEAEPDNDIERQALLELAEKNGVTIDGRWGNKRLKKELGLD